MITIIRNYDLGDIKTSINYLLDKASQSEEVRQLAIEIVADKPCSIAAIYDWVKASVTYTPDPVGVELFTSPVRMVNDYREGKPLAEDCDGMSIFITALCNSIGIRSNVVLLDTRGKGLDHALAEVSTDGMTLMVDPSDKDLPLGWEEKYYQKIVVS